MRKLLLLAGVALVGAGCAGSHPPHRTAVTKRPSSSLGVRPSPRTARRTPIAVARATSPRLFAIFPGAPGTRRCLIRSGAGLVRRTIRGTCLTRVSYPDTHGHGEARVLFREDWNGHFSSWTLWEELPSLKVLVTKRHGRESPQMRAIATD